MGLFSIEHGTLAYRADFAIYGAAIAGLAGLLIGAGPIDRPLPLLAWGLTGLAAWSLVEYALHRFVLHGVQPFRRWHAAHHERPRALICSPTLLTLGLFAGLVFAPAWACVGAWNAGAFTLGMLVGYLAYALTHHATHHGRTSSRWLRERKRWHALHHGSADPACFGVTSGFWDRVFGSGRRTPGR